MARNVGFMPATTPQVSVVIPTRNRWRLLRDHALACALAQEDVAFEIIVVDDASTDETPQRLSAFQGDKVLVIRHEARKNRSRARNAGLVAARGEWIAFLDDDDLWSPRMLSSQLEVAERSRASLVYSSLVVVDEALNVIERVEAADPRELERSLLRGSVIRSPCSAMVRTDLVRKVGGFDERLNEIEDWDLWIRVAAEARAAACKEVLAAYLVHQQNTNVRHDSRAFDDLEYLLDKHRTAREQADVIFDSVNFVRYVATGHLRANRRRQAASLYLRSARVDRSLGNALRAPLAILGKRALAIRQLRTARSARPEPAWIVERRRILREADSRDSEPA